MYKVITTERGDNSNARIILDPQESLIFAIENARHGDVVVNYYDWLESALAVLEGEYEGRVKVPAHGMDT